MKAEIKAVVGTLALLAISSIAKAAPPPPSDEAIRLPLDLNLSADSEEPALAAVPANDDLEREYPRVALMMGLDGRATITCLATIDGRLNDCHVFDEDPVGVGFGAATIRAAAYFRVKPGMKDGKPTEGKITIPLKWQTDQSHAEAAVPALAAVSPTSLVIARRVVALEEVAERTRTGWRPFLEQQTAELVAQGDAQAGQAVMDAFRQGLEDAVQEEVERETHDLGAHMSEANLRATADFLETPAGKAWVETERQSVLASQKFFYQRVAVLARNHYCPQPAAVPAPNRCPHLARISPYPRPSAL